MSAQKKIPIESLWLRRARFCIYLAPAVFFAFAAAAYINPSGYRHVSYSFENPSPMISQPFPAGRLARVSDGKQRVLAEPVYFTVRYPFRYADARVTITVLNPGELNWKIGLETNAGDGWGYDLRKPDEHGSVKFNLSGARVVDNKIRFIVSVDGLERASSFELGNLAVELKRKPLWLIN